MEDGNTASHPNCIRGYGLVLLVRHIVLVLVVPTSLRTARIAHSTKSYVGQAVLVLDSVQTEQWSVGVSECWSVAQNQDCTPHARG
jgi:hypothetical protein